MFAQQKFVGLFCLILATFLSCKGGDSGGGDAGAPKKEDVKFDITKDNGGLYEAKESTCAVISQGHVFEISQKTTVFGVDGVYGSIDENGNFQIQDTVGNLTPICTGKHQGNAIEMNCDNLTFDENGHSKIAGKCDIKANFIPIKTCAEDKECPYSYSCSDGKCSLCDTSHTCGEGMKMGANCKCELVLPLDAPPTDTPSSGGGGSEENTEPETDNEPSSSCSGTCGEGMEMGANCECVAVPASAPSPPLCGGIVCPLGYTCGAEDKCVGTQTWTKVENSEQGHLVFANNGAETIYAGKLAMTPTTCVVACGLYESNDGGKTWQDKNFTKPINAMLFANNTLYVGTNGDGVFKYDGSKWIDVSTGLTIITNKKVYSLVIGPDNTIYAGTGAGVYKLVNNAWASDNLLHVCYALYLSNINGSYKLYAGTSNGVYERAQNGIWTKKGTSVDNNSVKGLLLAPCASGNNFFARKSIKAPNLFLLLPDNNWKVFTGFSSTGSTESVTDLASSDNAIYIATHNNGIYKADSCGNNWQVLGGETSPSYINSLHMFKNTLYVSTANGIYLYAQ